MATEIANYLRGVCKMGATLKKSTLHRSSVQNVDCVRFDPGRNTVTATCAFAHPTERLRQTGSKLLATTAAAATSTCITK